MLFAVVAQLVEHVIGNDEVSGSIPDNGSRVSHLSSVGVNDNCLSFTLGSERSEEMPDAALRQGIGGRVVVSLVSYWYAHVAQLVEQRYRKP